ncbi:MULTISPECIES: GNAT family N-acetyltransferase [unclassified Micromonospora]|uniref:GNAT family N-acetyltransferase n=1 Tax=unclassified Micromonospora TaxID=2617518 RepID=UPI001C228E89|nr:MULTISPECIES: GNAT family N-acetyltransferase [unclassified Micromonospora]MBU8861110.1 GNAT family N-acetyltransferase [Micromonospora sp. WMMB482]MDM4780658.1 GNAT family N-acetyltransferase [Micromonospora sp. b486]
MDELTGALTSMSGCTPELIPTARLNLLPLGVGHAEEMAAVLADPALHTYIGGEPATPAALRARYERLVAGSPDPAESWCNWVIQLRDDGRLAGFVQATVTAPVGPSRHTATAGARVVGHRHLDEATPAAAGPVAEIAWVVGTQWQGRGIAAEAARGMAGWLGRRGVRTLMAHIHPGHRASAAVATACGLTPTDVWQDGEVRWTGATAPPPPAARS